MTVSLAGTFGRRYHTRYRRSSLAKMNMNPIGTQCRSLARLPLLLRLLALVSVMGRIQAGHEIAISQEQMERMGINLVAVETRFPLPPT